MKIVAPNYISQAPAANAPHVKHKDAVLAAVNGVTDKPALSFDEVRTQLGKDAKALPDGAIHQICLDAGIKVEAA